MPTPDPFRAVHVPLRDLIEAALDQPRPTPQLVATLNTALVVTGHPSQLLPET